MSKSDKMEQDWLDHEFGLATYTPGTHKYVALYTVAPGETGGGTEATGKGYSRVAIPQGSASWARVGSKTSTKIDVTFAGPVGGNWGTIVAAGVHSHPTNDTLRFYNPLEENRTSAEGQDITFAAGDISHEED